MSLPEDPFQDPVSISCTCCLFQDYGKLKDLEPSALRHARELGHPVRLSLGFLPVGAWTPEGTFRPMKGVDLTAYDAPERMRADL